MTVEGVATNASRSPFTILIAIYLCIGCTGFAFFTWFYSRLPLTLTAAFTVLMVVLGPVNIINQFIEE